MTKAERVAAHHANADENRKPGIMVETLNFKVTAEFKREFKGYAVSQGMTMLELLREGFELSKQKRKGE